MSVRIFFARLLMVIGGLIILGGGGCTVFLEVSYISSIITKGGSLDFELFLFPFILALVPLSIGGVLWKIGKKLR